MSNTIHFKDCVKGDVGTFRESMAMQQANRLGVHKSKEKDALTCFKQGCAQCYECRTMLCYCCKANIWECICKEGEGNIRLNPQLIFIPFEDYLEIVRAPYDE